MSAETISTIDTLFSIGTLFFMAASLILLIGAASRDKGPMFRWVNNNALILVFLVSLAGMLGSLAYEHLVGFPPCMLCWYQRIVMYPIVIITAVALIRKKAEEVLSYALALSILGALIGAWHNIEKLIGKELVSCDASGPSCLQTFVDGFGFIDIPVMSLTFFVLIILIIVTKKRFTANP